MKNKVDLKICRVCGDKALGYNFNAVTCESCKAFFRRNALIKKEFRCPFTNDCKITTVTRRFCQKCRLDKCFSIGMCKDLIMSDEDKAQKRQKIEENRAKKRCINGPSLHNKKLKKESIEADSQDSEVYSSSYNTDSDQDTNISDGYQPNNTSFSGIINSMHQNNSALNENNITSSSDRLVSSSEEHQSLNSSADNFCQIDLAMLNSMSSFINNNTINCNDNHVKTESLTRINSLRDNLSPPADNMANIAKDDGGDVQRFNPFGQSSNPIESILSEAIKLEYATYSSIAQSNSQSRELNDAEKAKLNELIVANKALSMPIEEDLNSIENDDCNDDMMKNQMTQHQQQQTDPALVELINLTALGIRRLIKMAKKISAFKNMCQEDQVALLKGGCTEIMMIISAKRYDPTKNSWKIPSIQEGRDVNVNILKLAKGNAHQEMERFIRTFDPKWRSDENIILILCAIVLFSPDRPRVVHQDVIKLEQNSYYYLLRRYLESVYSGCEAKSIFLKLIQKIMELHKVNDELINVFLNVNPSQIEPLLLEMFDLK